MSAASVTHLIVGPAEHGVVRHGVQVAGAAGHRVLRVAGHRAVPGLVHRRNTFESTDVVHLPFADGLFGTDCDLAAAAVDAVADVLDRLGVALSVTLHDVPVGDDARERRRRAAYARVIARARGVVVNSAVELAAVEALAGDVHALQCIPLPIDAVRASVRSGVDDRTDVVVLGFIWAGRGHEEVLAALPPGCGLTALGSVSTGHERMARELATAAAERGVRWTHTGYVDDSELPARLAGAGVPVAPNRHATASASIATWLAHGRRPLVPRTEYTSELAARMPGALWLYDDTAELTELIAAAVGDPGRTVLADQVRLGPSSQQVAERYRWHLAACAPPRLLERPGAAPLAPGNRWDLLAPGRDRLPPVSVVVPYYGVDDRAQRDLDRVLTGLRLQTIADRLEIVVADDGSPRPPDLDAAGAVPARVVRQEHDGFGAGRARNLGAAAAQHDLLAFLDGDTVPEPGYLEALLRLPATDDAGLVVGRRRHADLTPLLGGHVEDWLTGQGPAPAELPDPAWLRDGYRHTADLLQADNRSYRFVISAVLGVHRTLFDRLGGFDARFDTYGGEDWELAHRAWQAGALFAHVPEAVAWHNGPDWAGRATHDRHAVKAAERSILARLLPDPIERGAGRWSGYPHIVVTLPAADVAGVHATARSAFDRGVDCGLWLTGERAADIASRLADPRVHAGPPPRDVLARCVVQLELTQPRDLGAATELAALSERVGLIRCGTATARSTRALSRCETVDRADRDDAIAQLFGAQDSTMVPALPVAGRAAPGRIRQPAVSRS